MARDQQRQRRRQQRPRRPLRETQVVDPYTLEVADAVYSAQEDGDLTPAEAHAIASRGGVVVWDSCGCGGGCGYEVWTGREVDALVAAGPPVVRDGGLLALSGENGAQGVLVVQDVRWGPLR